MGRCPGCGGYGTLVEEPGAAPARRPQAAGGAQPLALVEAREADRISTGIPEVDRVLGGGMVPQAFLLLGGDPGIGKSTLLLQVAARVSGRGPVLYVTAEESARQLRLRAERLGASRDRLYCLAEGDVHAVESAIAGQAWQLVVVDSLQTVYNPDLESAPGSVAQVRDVAARLMRLAKDRPEGPAIFLVGHVNKEGSRRLCA